MGTELEQFSKPESNETGSKIILRMNESHKYIHNFARKYIDFSKCKTILDVGCGGGQNISDIVRLTNEKAKIYGIDYSEASIEHSKHLNAESVEKGIVSFEHTSLMESGFKSNMFDLIVAFETVYFWDNIVENFKKTYDLLADGGIFCIANECGKTLFCRKYEKIVKMMKLYSINDIKKILIAAGFTADKIEYNYKVTLRGPFTIRAQK